MPIRGSPNGARHSRPQGGRDRPEWVVAINRNAWSQSIGIAGRNHPVRADRGLGPASAGLPLRGRRGPGKGADPPGPPRFPNAEVDRVGKRSPAERHFRQAVL